MDIKFHKFLYIENCDFLYQIANWYDQGQFDYKTYFFTISLIELLKSVTTLLPSLYVGFNTDANWPLLPLLILQKTNYKNYLFFLPGGCEKFILSWKSYSFTKIYLSFDHFGLHFLGAL